MSACFGDEHSFAPATISIGFAGTNRFVPAATSAYFRDGKSITAREAAR